MVSKMDDNTYKLSVVAIKCAAIVILSLIWACSIYYYIDRAGPVRPVQTLQYYWPK